MLFRSSNWNGSAFTSAEGFHTWDTGTGVIAAGTVVRFSQIDQVEAMRAQNKFADRLRALHVYGGKVIRPEGVAVFNADGS